LGAAAVQFGIARLVAQQQRGATSGADVTQSAIQRLALDALAAQVDR
jgi:hypothetical protein